MLPLESTSVIEGITSLAEVFKSMSTEQVVLFLSLTTNGFFIFNLMTGRYIDHKLYKVATDEIKRLRRIMDKERDTIWLKLLQYLSGLKPKEGVDTDETTDGNGGSTS